jgi:glyoxylase-like metal-dependent hydrolase (beta-lactamase superfamily II)
VGDPPTPDVPDDVPDAHSARVDILLTGSLSDVDDTVVGTCTLIRDADRVIVVDPGLAPGPRAILDPLERLGHAPDAVTDVVLSHHHPDHTVNAALFPRAAVHDHWAIYRGDQWEGSDAEGRRLAPSVRLIRVPGHSAEDIATVVGTPDGVVVCTHLWWTSEGPNDDPYSPDLQALRSSRARVLAIADVIVPGHGPSFRPGPATPR